MAGDAKRPLKVFLCHASGDKPQVRALYKRLVAEGVDAWLDQEKLLPGQDWRVEIPRAVREADVVVVCLSNNSITKEGYIQKEIRFALDSAEEKPEGTIFLIPARLEGCIVPERLSGWQWVDLFDEGGFVRLLRSLKLRAAQVGATIEPLGYDSEVKEVEHRLDQLYTEGLAAFYTEDWDRAYRRFQAILRERPNHKNATEKLVQAERQRDFAKLYAQATEAYESEDWPAAINALEELLGKSGEYKDALQRLKDARKRKQLGELYSEAKKLHAAGKWQAVVRVFDQIHALDPGPADPDGLLPSAQKELAEIQRLTELNQLYSRGIREMDSGKWYEARSLLERVHKAQTGYLDTERLLRKVETEITNIEERTRRNNQINTLYEQAHGLVRSKNWRKASEKIEEIRKLDDQFEDKDGLDDKINAALGQEEQDAQKQNQLAAMYADAVRSVKEGKFQEALDKWHALRVIDPKYPDRQWVQRTAKRKLDELSRPEAAGQPWMKRMDWFRRKPNGPADRGMFVEDTFLPSFAVLVIIVALYLIDRDLLRISESNITARFLFLFLLGGLYGAVVAFALKRTIPNWYLKHTWVVIAGWALSHSVALVIQENFAGDFIAIVGLFTGLSVMVAIKWARPAIGTIRLFMIFASWFLSWKSGSLLGDHLLNVFDTEFVWVIADPLAILFGLLFTFGVQSERSWEVLKTAFFGALGFAAGNYVVDYVFALLPLPQEIGLGITIWGLIGGAILAAPSRNTRGILFTAGVCGIGLLVGFYAGLVAVPAIAGQSYTAEFPEQYDILQKAFRGFGLGLALGLLIRRPSAIGALAIFGAGIYTVAHIVFMRFIDAPSVWTSILSGGLIGLVLGYGYGYMREREPAINEANRVTKSEIGVPKISIPSWLRRPVIAWLALTVVVVLLWGIPIKSYMPVNQSVYLYSRPEHKNPQSGFLGIKGSIYYLCSYDLASRRYLIADSFWDCLMGNTRGWAETDIFPGQFWNLFVHKRFQVSTLIK